MELNRSEIEFKEMISTDMYATKLNQSMVRRGQKASIILPFIAAKSNGVYWPSIVKLTLAPYSTNTSMI